MENKIGSVERALSILDCFDHTRTALSLTVIAHLTGYYKSTILRLTESLVRYEYLERDGTKLYRLGPSVGRLGAIYQATTSAEKVIQPYLEELADRTEESSSYIILRNNKRVCQLQVNSKHRIRLHLEQGEELPVDSGASSYLLKTFHGMEVDDSPSIRERGWAISVGERDPEVASVTVALFGQSGKFYGALAVSGPVHRYTDNKRKDALKMLIEAATKLKPLLP